MASKPEGKPAGYPSLTPYLIVRDAPRAIQFYQQVFGATQRMRLPGPNGRVGHAELAIGDALVMLADEAPEHGALAPNPDHGRAVSLHLYVTDVDAVVKAAEAAGAKLLRPVDKQFYGDRTGTIIDPFGHVWHVSTHVEDVAPDEIERRAVALARSS